jgi:hypothetical protein
MSSAMINSAGLWASQISALSAQRTPNTNAVTAPGSSAPGTTAANGGASLFADLVSALTGGAVTVNGSAAVTAAQSSHSQISQDVQAFTQSLMQALSGGNGSAAGIAVPRGYAHGHDSMRGKLESLINTLSANGSSTAVNATSSASTGATIATLNTAFNKLMTDLGSNSSMDTGSAATVASTQSSSVTLRGLLQSMLQHLQQQGSWVASAGHVVHAVA